MLSPCVRRWKGLAVAVCLAFSTAFVDAATLVVTNVAESGPGSLRETLAGAANGDTITFAVTGTISNSLSELVISNNVDIIGPGPDVLALAGTNWSSRIFHILNGATSSVSGLTLRDSYAGLYVHGAGIYNEGNLALTNCTFLRCRSLSGAVAAGPSATGVPGGSAGNGGAIFNSGSLAVVNCNFLTNVASAGGYGAGGPGGYGGNGGNGGAIYNSGTLFALDCNFLANSAGAGGAGGSAWYQPGFGGLTYGSLGGNGGEGGAVYATGPAGFTRCTFAYNKTGTGGAGGSGLSGSAAVPGGTPGANGGRGGDGSAVFSAGPALITSCTFANNTAGGGGAGGNGGSGYNYPGGKAGSGGAGGNGALNCTGIAQLIACTLTGNAAGRGGNGGTGGAGSQNYPGGNGGHGGNGGNGGAIYGNTSIAYMSLRNVFAAVNNAYGSGGSAGGGGAGLFSGTSGTNGVSGTGMDLCGIFTSNGHNLIGLRTGNTGFTNNVAGDIVGTNVPIYLLITSPGQYGGPTLTCRLMPMYSPQTNSAINAGDDTLLDPPFDLSSDQRGLPRASGGHVDIGAFESQWAAPPFVLSIATTNDLICLKLTNSPHVDGTFMVQTASTLSDGWTSIGRMSETVSGEYQWSDIATNSQLFYRVRWP